MGQNIYIKPLMKAPDLAQRQLRMMIGLIKEGLSKDEVRALQWYDPALEVYYPSVSTIIDRFFPEESTAVHTPVHNDPVDTPVDTSVDRDVDTNPDPDDVRHGGDLKANRKAYKKDWTAKKRARSRVS